MAKKKAAAAPVPAPSVDKREYRDFIDGLHLVDITVRRSATARKAKVIDMSRKVDIDIHDKATFAMQEDGTCLEAFRRLEVMARR